MYITDLLSRSLENSALDVTLRAVNALAEQYHFPAEEAIAYLKLEKLSLNRKQLAKKASGVKEPRGAVKSKTVKAKADKLGFSLPFCGVIVESMCTGLKYDSGLFTQCTSTRGEEGFCKGCTSQMSKSGSAFPDCGTVGQRLAVEPMEYQDPKGRKPVAYAKYMEKKGLNIDQVKEAAGKLGITIPEVHFEAPLKKVRATSSKGGDDSKKRGRPKKEAKVVESSSVDDLFENLAKEASSPRASLQVIEEVKVEDDSASKSDDESASSTSSKPKKEKKAKMSDAEKAELAAMKEVEKEQKKVAAEAEKQAKKEAAEAEKQAKKEAAEAEKQAKKEAAEAEKVAKKAAADAEKQAKKEATEAKKGTEKPKKSKAAEKPAMIGGGGGGGGAAQEEPEVKKKVTVTKFTFEGKSYLRSAEGVVYDAETKDDVGMWNEVTKEVDFFEEEDDEELEEEEDEDEDEEA